MSEFSRDLQDYMEITFSEIESDFGDTVSDSIRDSFELELLDLLDRLDYAESEGELELARADLESFFISAGEIQSRAEEIELEQLTDYMSQSYKDDKEKIDRYLRLTGQGKYAK